MTERNTIDPKMSSLATKNTSLAQRSRQKLKPIHQKQVMIVMKKSIPESESRAVVTVSAAVVRSF